MQKRRESSSDHEREQLNGGDPKYQRR